MRTTEEVVLIFQIGSMGDTVISMPCYREIARRYPDATRYLLTNYPTGKKMVPAESILSGTGLIAGSVEYPMPLRGKDAIIELYEKVRSLGAKTLYYLTPETRLHRLIRHYAFFRICGITSINGVPWSRDLRYPRKLDGRDLWESEASRLLRCIGARTEAGPPPPADRGLDLTPDERNSALAPMQQAIGDRPFVAISVGGKVPVNNWGDDNWSALLAKLSREYPGLAAVFVGSADERERNEDLAQSWEGPVFNSCGLFAPRETASLIEQASLFMGHDTGTLHLAGAVGTKIVGVYSARNVPGKWYSDRPGDTFFYNKVGCFGCECVKVCECPSDRRCITSIHPDQVFEAAQTCLRPARQAGRQPASCDARIPGTPTLQN
jgi:ADP-heptose:LPS heptosyltransferase